MGRSEIDKQDYVSSTAYCDAENQYMPSDEIEKIACVGTASDGMYIELVYIDNQRIEIRGDGKRRLRSFDVEAFDSAIAAFYAMLNRQRAHEQVFHR